MPLKELHAAILNLSPNDQLTLIRLILDSLQSTWRTSQAEHPNHGTLLSLRGIATLTDNNPAPDYGDYLMEKYGQV